MGIDTHLYINSKWRIDEIIAVIESRLDTKVNVERTQSADYVVLGFKYKTERRISLFMDSHTPIGYFTYMSLGFNEEAVEIMTIIGKVFGGLLEENDCDCKMEFIEGDLDERNALPYFMNYAVIHDKANPNSLVDLIKSIKKWETDIKKHQTGYKSNIIMPKN